MKGKLKAIKTLFYLTKVTFIPLQWLTFILQRALGGAYFNIFHLSSILSFLLVITACSEDETSNLEYPLVHTGEVTNITSSGATFSAKIVKTGNDEITDHGFVWGPMNAPSVDDKATNVWSLGTFTGKDTYSVEVHAELMANTTLYVRAYAKTDGYITYGNAVAFLSLGSKAPFIESFSPIEARVGDTIHIEGKYFSAKKDSIKVSFGTQSALVISSDTNHITTIVPAILDTLESAISVSIFGNISTSIQKFKIAPPVIHSFSPDTAKALNEITVFGSNFVITKTIIRFNDKAGEIVYADSGKIKVLLPPGLPPGPLTVSADNFGQIGEAQQSLINISPYIESFSPKVGTYGDIITIKGQNFKKPFIYFDNIVRFNYVEAKLIYSSETLIRAVVPTGLTDKYAVVSVIAGDSYTFSDTAFTLRPPVVQKVIPNEVIPNTHFEIFGKNFNPIEYKNVVTIGGVEATVVDAEGNKLVVQVPEGLPEGSLSLSVTIGEQTSTSAEEIRVISHTVDSFSPAAAGFGDTLIVQGKNFNVLPEDVIIHFNEILADEIIAVTPEQISVVVPPTLSSTTAEVSVEIGGIKKVIDTKFTLLPPLISGFSPDRGVVGDQITISGKYFSPVLENNQVFFGTEEAEILFAERNNITVKIPDKAPPKDRITVVVLNELSTTSATSFVLPIVKKADFGGKPRYGAVSFTINEVAYVGLGLYSPPSGGSGKESFQDLWAYDAQTDTWTQKADFPGGTRLLAVSFVINEKGYIATGTENFESFRNEEYLNDLWEYNPVSNQWTQKAPLPGEKRIGAVGFAVQNKGYIATGSYYNWYDLLNDVWEYDPITDKWVQKADFPGKPRQGSVAFAIGNRGYLGTGRAYEENVETANRADFKDFWEYDPLNDIWVRKADYSGPEGADGIGFELNGKGIVGLGIGRVDADEILREYDPATDTWRTLMRVGGLHEGWRQHSIGFSINGKAYIGLGRNNWSIFGDIWEYDPNR